MMQQFAENCCLWEQLNTGEIIGELSLMQGTPHWGRGRSLLPEQQQGGTVLNCSNPHSLSPCATGRDEVELRKRKGWQMVF